MIRISLGNAAPQQLFRAAIRLCNFRSVRLVVYASILPQWQDELSGLIAQSQRELQNFAKRGLGHWFNCVARLPPTILGGSCNMSETRSARLMRADGAALRKILVLLRRASVYRLHEGGGIRNR